MTENQQKIHVDDHLPTYGFECIDDPKYKEIPVKERETKYSNLRSSFEKKINHTSFDAYKFFISCTKRQVSLLAEVTRGWRYPWKKPHREGNICKDSDYGFMFWCLMGDAAKAKEIYIKHKNEPYFSRIGQAFHDQTKPNYNDYETVDLQIDDIPLTQGLQIAFQLKHTDVFVELVRYVSDSRLEVLAEYCTDSDLSDITKENLEMIEELFDICPFDLRPKLQPKISAFLDSFKEKDVDYAFPDVDEANEMEKNEANVKNSVNNNPIMDNQN